jgi:NADH:ubiquinone reductase (H+-translocating)
MSTRVVIIGGGFAGLAAARRLRRSRVPVDCTLIDRRDAFHFLPLLPDLLSRPLDPALLRYPFADLAGPLALRFLRADVAAVDLAARSLATSAGPVPYDLLVIASGCETDFSGRDDLAHFAFTLTSVDEALKLRAAALAADFRSAVVVGGGYTGIEVATHLVRLFRRTGRPRPVLIVEQVPSVLARLPGWVSHYAARNLRAMGVDVLHHASVRDVSNFAGSVGDVRLVDGRLIPRALLVWSAGVRTGGFLAGLDVPKGRHARLVVDPCLRLNDSCFVCGDAACFLSAGQPVGMSVQAALDEGDCAGANVARLVAARPLKTFSPMVLGWVVPMANGRSVGQALGISVRGRPASFLHYLMCVFRSMGLARRLRLARQLLFPC